MKNYRETSMNDEIDSREARNVRRNLVLVLDRNSGHSVFDDRMLLFV